MFAEKQEISKLRQVYEVSENKAYKKNLWRPSANY